MAQEVVFEVGALARLGQLVAERGWQRLQLCTSPSLVENGHAEAVATALGDKLVARYVDVRPHGPDFQVAEALSLALSSDIDALIGLGGGSPIGMAKAVSLEMEAKKTGQAVAQATFPTEQPLVPTIAIPTTYAGSEMTPVYGVTRVQAGGSTRKVTVRDPKVTPKLTIYDPELTLSLPREMTATTGINALAHCIEAVYSKTRNPLSTGVALRGIYHITRSLPRCVQDEQDLEARIEMQVGAHLAGMSLATVTMGLHHGTGHVLGGTAGVPHGVANCIVLPHAIRFNADAVAPELAMVAEAMGIGHGRSDYAMALAAADAAYDLIGQLGVPQRLRDVGVEESLLPRLAENMLESNAIGNNRKPVTTREQALAFLQEIW